MADPPAQPSNQAELLQDPAARKSDAQSGPAAPQSDATEQFRMPSPEEMQAQDFMNNCFVRSAFAGVAGGGMGLFMGLLLGSFSDPFVDETGWTSRQKLMHTLRQMGSRSYSTAKAFAVMGAVFSGSECVIEKARAKHDMYNGMLAGCFTGGVLAAQAGPQAACIGCVGFAAFSVVIDKFLERD
ncbi:mitochondrial import inner membrane translocase subunit [Klebsormidium nitens]|uniref:Mitochondrial import inner membrane translocase subunit n=1 Tax=Klebsormidium nitens TaxID=105231 RepID=A0A1Y1IFY5_KLENI|nr:mitochondrial import inner membrane translocase subunit [Klebsormidium nitens]|eukprot:GAQ89760.1 mitochondrial import inner membrane translocase subunit [Klebsormidium nitens]